MANQVLRNRVQNRRHHGRVLKGPVSLGVQFQHYPGCGSRSRARRIRRSFAMTWAIGVRCSFEVGHELQRLKGVVDVIVGNVMVNRLRLDLLLMIANPSRQDVGANAIAAGSVVDASQRDIALESGMD